MADECALEPDIRALRSTRRPDAAAARLARAQHGVVTRSQLTEIGLTRRAIGHRLENGRLHRVHRAVYAVGHLDLSAEGRWLAAVLACGRGAALSHRSAAALWGIRPAASTRIEVTAGRSVRSRGSILVHAGALPDDERATVCGIPVTSPSRTLLDLAGQLRPSELERALAEAEALRLTDRLSLPTLTARHRGRRGLEAARRLLQRAEPPARTRSRLEERFLDLVDTHDLPRPETNVHLELRDGLVEVDCAWRADRLVLELDGFAHHGSQAAFRRDRARDRMLQAAGWRVVRVSWSDVAHEPDRLAQDLAVLLLERSRTAAPPA